MRGTSRYLTGSDVSCMPIISTMELRNLPLIPDVKGAFGKINIEA
jgi:hypothetical protein